MNIRRAKGHGRYATMEIGASRLSPGWHVKLRPGEFANQQGSEADRVNWLAGRLSTPRRARTIRLPGVSLLVTDTVEGTPSHKLVGELSPSSIISGLIDAISILRSADLGVIPFQQPHWATDAGIANNIAQLKTSKNKRRDLHPDFSSRTFLELKDIAESGRENTAQSLVHADLCMPNVLLDEDGGFAGLVDLGNLHVGDTHLDLAVASWTTRANMGEVWEKYLLSNYGDYPLNYCVDISRNICYNTR